MAGPGLLVERPGESAGRFGAENGVMTTSDMHAASFRASSVQFESAPGDTARNLATVERFAREAAAAGSRLVVFPEMCLTGYWYLHDRSAAEVEALAEPADGPLVTSVQRLAADLGIGIGAGFVERDPDGTLYNSYAVCLPDGACHVHRKLHAFIHEAIASGDRYTVFDTPWGIRMGVLTCYDNNIIENARATALLGAQVLLAPHQTGGTRSRSPRGMKPIPREVWERRLRDPQGVEDVFRGPNGRGWLMRWLPSRAHDNGMFVLFSNGVGPDGDEVRTGGAMILDPYGEILTETWAPRDARVTADLDLSLIPLSNGRRWMRARRPELYDLLVRPDGREVDARTARFSDEPARL
jgi:predicted amidohydrolase